MIKKKYIINMATNNMECIDPNLDLALVEIRDMKRLYNANFDFEISCLFDGFVIDYNFDKALNTFLNDISNEDNLFNYIFKSKDFTKHIKHFIVNCYGSSANINNCDENNSHLMEAFLYSDFYFRFTLPKTIITQEKFREFIGLGPEYLLGSLHTDEIFSYIVSHLYASLSENGLLDREELKDYGKYQYGLA